MTKKEIKEGDILLFQPRRNSVKYNINQVLLVTKINSAFDYESDDTISGIWDKQGWDDNVHLPFASKNYGQLIKFDKSKFEYSFTYDKSIGSRILSMIVNKFPEDLI